MSREEIMNDLQEPQEEDRELEMFINELRGYYKTFINVADRKEALSRLERRLREQNTKAPASEEPTNQLPPLDDSLVSKRVVADAICGVCSILDKQNCSGRKENSDWCEYITALRKLPGEKRI